MPKSSVDAIDLFCGAGGMSLGAELAGIQIRVAVELDARAAQTFRYNHRRVDLLVADVRQVTAGDLGLKQQSRTVLFGGPPCRGFSTSNQRTRNRGNLNNWLFLEYLRLLREIRPQWAVLENVKGLVETDGGFFLNTVVRGFMDAGYRTTSFVLDAANFGVPQHRNRVFVVGSRDGTLLPTPVGSPGRIPVSSALRDLPALDNGASEDIGVYSSPARTGYARRMREGLRSCHNHLVTYNATHIVKRYKHVPPGGNWEAIPARLMGNYADRSRCHTGLYRRLRPDDVATVIGNFRKNMLIHPWQDRGLSIREAARLQSFPDRFRFFGSIGFQQQQVGNAVPPLLAKAVFDQILRFS